MSGHSDDAQYPPRCRSGQIRLPFSISRAGRESTRPSIASEQSRVWRPTRRCLYGGHNPFGFQGVFSTDPRLRCVVQHKQHGTARGRANARETSLHPLHLKRPVVERLDNCAFRWICRRITSGLAAEAVS